MEIDSLPSTESNSVEIKDIFKKPDFIGPKKGLKSNTKKSVNDINILGGHFDKDVELNPKELSSFPSLQYTEPNWKGIPSEDYFLEELKSGVIQKRFKLSKRSVIVFGRSDICDVVMAHPTISRYHSILQYRTVPDGDCDKGFYLYDLESTHGTFLNKSKIKPRVYARIKVGHMIKFGCSTRFFLLQGPENDQEEESALTLTELKEKRRLEIEEKKRKEEEEIRLKEEDEEREKKLIEERGVSWGLGEDADEEDDLSENPYALTTNEELYSEDPKKALRQWFEREGEEMKLLTEQAEKGMIVCKITLPLDDGAGKEIVVEISARSRKEAQFQCSLEACRTIDKIGLFRQSKQESKRQQKRNWEENDYYDSDEDSFFDRTGDLDLKRQKRMKKAGKIQEKVETYESLMEKHDSVGKLLNEFELKLQKLLDLDQGTTESENEDLDDLDKFMNSLKQDKPSKLDIKIAKDEVEKLKKEEDHLRKLINIVKPTSLPELKPFKAVPVVSSNDDIVEKEVKKLENIEQKDLKPKEMGHNKLVHKTIEPEVKESKVIGPTIPPPDELLFIGLKNKISFKKNKKPKVDAEKEVLKEPEDDCVNLVWQPPKGQTGDGRTSLNDKFGY